MKEGWMENEWRMMKDVEWMMKDADFRAVEGFSVWAITLLNYITKIDQN